MAAGSIFSYLIFGQVLGTAVVVGTSMMPTLHPSQFCLVEKWPYTLGSPRRGDMVAFRQPGLDGLTVKRIVAVPGDEICFDRLSVLVNGSRLTEPYLDPGSVTTSGRVAPRRPVKMGADEYFVLGDNRGDSEDSRFTGAVREQWLIGRVRPLLP